MAIGTTAAIIGGSLLGVGGSVLSARSQSRAASNAADAAQDSSDAQIALARETRDGQIERSEPFRQLELQQGNAIGEIYGFNRVGDGQPQPLPRQQSFNGYLGAGIGGTRFNPQNQELTNGSRFLGRAIGSVGGEPDFTSFLQNYNRGQSQGPSQQQAQQMQAPQVSANSVNISAQDAARERFEGSMFNDVYRAGHARDVDRIDAGLGASGLAFSGARMQAVEDARADRFGNTFNNYFSGLMRQAPQSATNEQNRAASTFGTNAASAIGANGQAQANSAYQRGQANAGIWNGVAGLGGYALGGGFSKPTSGGI